MVTAEQFFKPSLLLRNPEGQPGQNISYNINSFGDMEVIGEGTYGKVFKARLSEVHFRQHSKLGRSIKQEAEDSEMIVQ